MPALFQAPLPSPNDGYGTKPHLTSPPPLSLPPLPTSKTQANLLLHQRADVNIIDYIAARSKHTGPVPWGHFSHLVFDTVAELVQ